MDLSIIGTQMRLDALAVVVSDRLTAAGLPHALLKGPSTARWLYSPPRLYRDVDLLVPGSRFKDVVAALERSGLAASVAGRQGEASRHAQVLRAGNGLEIDVHDTLPLMRVTSRDDADAVWRGLTGHLDELALDTGRVPCLDLAGRCLVIALHALGDPDDASQAAEDLRRARRQASAEIWQRAQELADRLGVAAMFQTALGLADGENDSALPVEVQLIRQGSSGAFQLSRLLAEPYHRRPYMILREVFPSGEFMRYAAGDPSLRGAALLLTYVQRTARLSRSLPGQVRALRKAQSALTRSIRGNPDA